MTKKLDDLVLLLLRTEKRSDVIDIYQQDAGVSRDEASDKVKRLARDHEIGTTRRIVESIGMMLAFVIVLLFFAFVFTQ